jgi:putative membrane protein
MATGPGLADAVVLAFLLAAGVGYVLGTRRHRRWPERRTQFWVGGLAVAALPLLIPAEHGDFVAHMAGHLLLGMAAPLLLAFGAPITLALGALPVHRARVLSRVLRRLRFLTHPAVAAVLNAGGLWLLYRTALYSTLTAHSWTHALLHAHFLITGYLFVAGIAGPDPAPHRPSFRTRALVLVLFIAAHDILAKTIYAHPPAGVLPGDAETAGPLMYYGGDLLDLVLVALLCARWFPAPRSTPSRPASGAAPSPATSRSPEWAGPFLRTEENHCA